MFIVTIIYETKCIKRFVSVKYVKILAQKSKPFDQDKDPIKFDIIPYLQSN